MMMTLSTANIIFDMKQVFHSQGLKAPTVIFLPPETYDALPSDLFTTGLSKDSFECLDVKVCRESA
jgi:hypothetical protein